MLPFLLALALRGDIPTRTQPPQTTSAVDRLATMTALYDALCLCAFPDDTALAAAVAAHGGTPLTSDEVKVTLRDDPGRGWAIRAAGVTALVFLELPPYHACSIRWPMPQEVGPLSDYRVLAAAYEASRPGFAAVPPYDADAEGLEVHMTADRRSLPDGGAEALMVVEQHVADPVRRAAGETGTMLRFVHQFAPPEPH